MTYLGTTKTRFDRDYYVAHHLPLVIEAWSPYGLKSVAALFPATTKPRTIALCECRFRDVAAMRLAFASPTTADVMADVCHFTDITPARALAVAL